MTDHETIIPKEIATFVVDSATSLEYSARRHSMVEVQPTAKDGRKHWAYSTEQLTDFLTHLTGLPCHVAVICHTSEDKDHVNDMFVRNPKFPGKMATKVCSDFIEIYRTFVKLENGERNHWLQTKPDGIWNAASQLNAPNPCIPHFKALFDGKWDYGWTPAIKALVMGDPTSGKSTFLTTWPSPKVVLCTDAVGKHIPYLKAGSFIKEEDYFSAEKVSGLTNLFDCPVSVVRSKDRSKIITHIYHFNDTELQRATAWPNVRNVMAALSKHSTLIDGQA